MNKTKKIGAGFLLASMIIASVPFLQAEASSTTGVVSVKAASLYVRSDDNFSAKVVKVAHKGQSYKVYGKSNGMFNIGGKQWITASTKYVSYSNKPVTSSTTSVSGKVTVTAGSLYIRSSASFSAKTVGVAKQGQSFNILESRNGLYRIGVNQWITASSKYVTINGKVTTTVGSAAPSTTVSTSKFQSLYNFGKRYLGMPYVWSSSNPANGGFDCSGFIYYMFKNNGYNVPRLNVEGYWNSSIVQHISSPQPGDLVFFKNTYRIGPSHIGMYIGNGQMIDSNGAHGLSIDNLSSSYWKSHFLGYGRFK
jgi:cell wall-associated NlpC family hydrolase